MTCTSQKIFGHVPHVRYFVTFTLFCTDHSDIKEAVNKHAFERFEKNVKSAESIAKAEAAGVSKRFESK